MNWNELLLNYNPDDKFRDEVTGLVFDIQRFAIHDGGGIRTLVFLKGCPLNCLWCQNPESISHKPQVVYVANNCIHCGKCLSVCPENAITGDKRIINRSQCTLCGECIEHCYAGALNIVGRYLTISEVMDIVERDREFYENSGGGVTFSGGEPTAQPEFLEALCRESQARGLHTAIETCGHGKWETYEPILQHTDLVLMDVKHTAPDEHRRLTGISNKLILENLQHIAAAEIPLRVRLPLVPGCNDDLENIRATAKLLSDLPNTPALDILPYHRLGEPKWGQLDSSYQLHDTVPPSPEHVQTLAEVIGEYGIEVNVGG